jgi:hypothetical protein
LTLAAGQIAASKIASNSIAALQMGTGSVTSDAIADNGIKAVDMGTSSVTSDAILNGSIAAIDLGAGVVTSAAIATNGITASNMGTSSVTSDAILDGTIVNADVNASAAIDGTKVTAASTTIRGTVSLETVSSDVYAYHVVTANDARLSDGRTDANALHVAGGTMTGPITADATAGIYVGAHPGISGTFTTVTFVATFEKGICTGFTTL